MPGRAKTRLIPRLGAWRSAALQRRLIVSSVRTALDSRCGEVELHVTPWPQHAFFRSLARRLSIRVRAQSGADLGERMHQAIRRARRSARAAILIGSDCPALRPSDLRRALRLLQGGSDVVLAPAEDGGYALIAARRVAPEMFSAMRWGEADVYEKTLQRIEGARLRAHALRTVWDVDRPDDVDRLRSLRFSSGWPPSARR